MSHFEKKREMMWMGQLIRLRELPLKITGHRLSVEVSHRDFLNPVIGGEDRGNEGQISL